MKAITTMCIAIGAAAACGPAAPGQATTVGNSGTAAPAKAAATPCPEGEALAETARAAWKKGAGSIYATCVAVSSGGETLWYLDGYFEPEPNDDYMVGMWTALVTPAGEVRWADGADDFPYGVVMKDASGGHQAVDLDGDGNDEIVFVGGYSHGGYDSYMLGVLKVGASGVQAAEGEVALSHDNSAAEPDPSELATCDATHELVDAGGKKHIRITYAGDCERTGPVTYAYDGKALVEVK